MSRRKLLRLSLLSLLIVTVAGSLWTSNHSQQFSAPVNNQTQTNQSTTPTPTLTQDQIEEQQLFAAMPQLMLYYSFTQTNNARNVFQSDPTDTKRRSIEVGFPGGYQFNTSPDGQQFIRYSSRNIQWSSSQELTKFKTIFQTTDEASINSVMYSSDSSQLAVTTTQKQTGQIANTVYVLNGDTQTVITTLIQEHPIKLIGYIQKQSLWFATDNNGQLANLSRYDLSTQIIDDSTYSLLNTGQLLSKMTFSRDMTWAYYYTASTASVFNMTTRQTKIIAQVPTTCPNNHVNNSAITGFGASLTSNLALVASKQVPCSSGSNQAAKATHEVTLINNQTGEVARQINQEIAFSKAYWSTNNDYVWLSLDADHNFMVTIASLSIQPIPDAERQALYKEKLYFTGWLTGK